MGAFFTNTSGKDGMKTPRELGPEEFLAREDEFDSVIDARSPAEYALDHVPGAINIPVLSNTERAEVGLINAERSPFDAHRLGAAYVSENIARALHGPLADRPREWRPVVYCWRGGQRSGSLATVLARVGWQTHLIKGGYKAWRRAMLSAMESHVARLGLVVLAGRTGAGKSRILNRMSELGAQVLDLEALAEHRGSVLGSLPGAPQPSQKRFESRLWDMIRRLDPKRPVWVESESRKIGALQVPECLILRMRAAPCVVADVPRPVRAGLLMKDSEHHVAMPAELKRLLETLRPLHGQAVLDTWMRLIDGGDWPAFVERILAEHYDPAYDRSMARNYLSPGHGALTLHVDEGTHPDDMIDALARQAMRAEPAL